MLTRVGSHPLGWASNFKVSARSEWFLGMDRLAAPTGQRDRITEVNFVRRHSSRAANECRFHSDHDAFPTADQIAVGAQQQGAGSNQRPDGKKAIFKGG
jgi:hypothetical protein